MPDDFDDIRTLEALAEKAYDAIYESRSPGAAGVCYSDAKSISMTRSAPHAA